MKAFLIRMYGVLKKVSNVIRNYSGIQIRMVYVMEKFWSSQENVNG